MFQCAWCKKDSNVWEWSKWHEPLCSKCSNKYHFGLTQKMITEKISNLSKEQRRKISEKRHNLIRFIGAMRSIEKEILVGKTKTASIILGIILGIIIIGTLVFYSSLFEKNVLVRMLIFPVLIILAWMLHCRLKWLLKFYQLKKEAEYSIDFFYDKESF